MPSRHLKALKKKERKPSCKTTFTGARRTSFFKIRGGSSTSSGLRGLGVEGSGFGTSAKGRVHGFRCLVLQAEVLGLLPKAF